MCSLSGDQAANDREADDFDDGSPPTRVKFKYGSSFIRGTERAAVYSVIRAKLQGWKMQEWNKLV